MVDEYQDTNYVQKKILTLLYNVMEEKAICAVGDDSQSIYSFRGANIDNILSFTRDFPAEMVTMRVSSNWNRTTALPRPSLRRLTV